MESKWRVHSHLQALVQLNRTGGSFTARALLATTNEPDTAADRWSRSGSITSIHGFYQFCEDESQTEAVMTEQSKGEKTTKKKKNNNNNVGLVFFFHNKRWAVRSVFMLSLWDMRIYFSK